MKIAELVSKTASGPNGGTDALLQSLHDLQADNPDINYGSLMGSAIGLSAEGGEFAELVKKHVFQGAPLDRVHAMKELGDIRWYFALACAGLGCTVEEIDEVVSEKLLKRYKNGFTVDESNNRKKDDI